jgi:hypothetical protein
VAAGDADLLFDQVEIIEQPFRGRRDLAPLLDGGGQLVAGGIDDGGVFRQPRQQAVGTTALAEA